MTTAHKDMTAILSTSILQRVSALQRLCGGQLDDPFVIQALRSMFPESIVVHHTAQDRTPYIAIVDSSENRLVINRMEYPGETFGEAESNEGELSHMVYGLTGLLFGGELDAEDYYQRYRYAAISTYRRLCKKMHLYSIAPREEYGEEASAQIATVFRCSLITYVDPHKIPAYPMADIRWLERQEGPFRHLSAEIRLKVRIDGVWVGPPCKGDNEHDFHLAYVSAGYAGHADWKCKHCGLNATSMGDLIARDNHAATYIYEMLNQAI